MQLTTKGKFAVVAMIEVGLRSPQRPVSLAEIARRHQMSLSYLEQLFCKLRRQGLVCSIRGPGGGYVLGHEPASITLADIVAAVDAPADFLPEESSFSPSSGSQRCDTSGLWQAINSEALRLLREIALETLVECQRGRQATVDEAPVRRGISPRPVVKPIHTNAPNSVFALGARLSNG